jgi:hypothetical protein
MGLIATGNTSTISTTNSSANQLLSSISSSDLTETQMNALWTFEGHTLRELQPVDKQPKTGSEEAKGPDLDEEGHPFMYGSCGRDKRYARCSVCYFRGLRCNSAHYCSFCQRVVCIRPRIYPGEEHPKICWNVLHLDKDMIGRVEKKKKRRIQPMGNNSPPRPMISTSITTVIGKETNTNAMPNDANTASSTRVTTPCSYSKFSTGSTSTTTGPTIMGTLPLIGTTAESSVTSLHGSTIPMSL